MNRSRRLGLAAAAFGALFLVVGVGVAVCALRGCGLGSCALGHTFGWVVPLVAAVVLGGSTWLLLGQADAEDDSTHLPAAAECASCRKEILGQWRMCPYCGAMLGDQSNTTRIAAGREASEPAPAE